MQSFGAGLSRREAQISQKRRVEGCKSSRVQGGALAAGGRVRSGYIYYEDGSDISGGSE